MKMRLSEAEARECHRLHQAKYRARHPDRILAQRLAAKDRMREYLRCWYLTPKGRVQKKRKEHRRRMRRLKTGGISRLTLAQWNHLLELYDNGCAYCGNPFDLVNPPEHDLILAVSKGGNHTADNVVPACRDCNKRKKANIWAPRDWRPTHEKAA